MKYILLLLSIITSAVAAPRTVRVFISNATAPGASSHVLMEFTPNGAWGQHWFLPAGATAVYDVTVPDPVSGYNDYFRMRDAGGTSITQMSTRTLEDIKPGFEALYIHAASQSSGQLYAMEKTSIPGGAGGGGAVSEVTPEQAWTTFWLGVGLVVSCGIVMLYITGIRKAVTQTI